MTIKKNLFTCLFVLISTSFAFAAKTIYVPEEWRNFNSNDTLLYAPTDTQNKYTWSLSRSKQSDNVIVFWDKYYGSKAPNQLSTTDELYVDIDDLLTKAEAFYQLECNTLGFVDPTTSNVSKYKVMILLNHTRDWVCYGGGYDFQVPALWLSPSTCKPVGHSVAHEIGHAFHYMCYAEDSSHGANSSIQTGFHGAVGNGSVTWEQTAQWQANQSYPELMFDQSIGVFRNSHNYAFTHEWHRYQSYWFFYYLCQHYNDIKTVAGIWNHRETSVKDFNEVLMDAKGLSVDELYALYFDYALRCVTWDFDVCAPYRNAYIGDFNYSCQRLTATSYQVDFASAPQSTGFNVIELGVPATGKAVTTRFTALAPGSSLANGDPALYLNENSAFASASRATYSDAGKNSDRGFRIGYVALLADGTRTYYNDGLRHGTLSSAATDEITFTPPAGTQRLWLVISPAPATYYRHLWDESIDGDDQWPYQFELLGTNLKEYAQIDGREIADISFDFDVELKPSSDYDGATLSLQGSVMDGLSKAFQLTQTEIYSRITKATTSGPSNGQIMGYPVKADGTLNYSTQTANGIIGHWFDDTGEVTNWADNSYVFSEFDAYANCTIGQFPGLNHDGDQRTIRQAWVYKNSSGQTATAYFRFSISFDDDATNTATLTATDYAGDPSLAGDVNRDGALTIADVTALVNVILSPDNLESQAYDQEAADVNADQKITIADVTALVNLILAK